MNKPKMLDLFSGIGGFSLAGEWAGFETVAFCEIEPYCQKLLTKHWPGVPIFNDIRTLTVESLRERGIGQPDILCGGFPCQPFSCAGKRAGTADNRYLWPEMLRVIAQTRPHFVLIENVANLVKMALDIVLSDLEDEGYSTGTLLIPACAVGALHIRSRVFVVAFSESIGGKQCRGVKRKTERIEAEQLYFWQRESMPARVANGIPRRMDRLRGIGNAIVPQVAYPILTAIREYLP